jgi:ribose transport system ATP-binding protein
VMYGGRIARELFGRDLNERNIIETALNVNGKEQAA